MDLFSVYNYYNNLLSAGKNFAATGYSTYASINPFASSVFSYPFYNSYAKNVSNYTNNLYNNYQKRRKNFNFNYVYNGIKQTAKKAYNNVTGGAKAVVDNARKFLGYNEKDGSYKLFTGGRTEAWCADFVSYIARQTGVKGFNFPSVQGILDWGRTNGRFSKTPKIGDAIILKGWDPKRKKYASHTGIVTRIENGKVYTIEGNTSKDNVAEQSYSLNDSKITGFVSIA